MTKKVVLSFGENSRNTAKEMGLNLSGFLQSKLVEFIKNNKDNDFLNQERTKRAAAGS